MKKIVLIEDEIPALHKLKRFLNQVGEPIQVVAEFDKVQDAIAYLQNHEVDLIISDIELRDGNAFEIFESTPLVCPIIFTTAYDQFAMAAFETNGIAYLLKPFNQEKFNQAWHKYELLSSKQESSYKPHFLKNLKISEPNGFYFIETDKISYFEAEEGIVYAHLENGQRKILTENTLKFLEEKLDPMQFFRIHRSFLINRNHIENMKKYDKNSLLIKMKGQKETLKSSQTLTPKFRNWLENP